MSANNAEKLLLKARSSPKGWTAKELIRLYRAYDFGITAGSNHDLAKHKALPAGIKGTISRTSKELHPDYVRTAIKLIEMILQKDQ